MITTQPQIVALMQLSIYVTSLVDELHPYGLAARDQKQKVMPDEEKT